MLAWQFRIVPKQVVPMQVSSTVRGHALVRKVNTNLYLMMSVAKGTKLRAWPSRRAHAMSQIRMLQSGILVSI